MWTRRRRYIWPEVEFGPADVPLETVIADTTAVRAGLAAAAVPGPLIVSVRTRSLLSGRRQTGPFQSNREPRWQLQAADPQYGPEWECRVINLRLLGMMLEFAGAPAVSPATRAILEKYLERPIQNDAYRDALTLESIQWAAVVAETLAPIHGVASIHIGHLDPKAVPKHSPENVTWRLHRSNLIQGDLTLRQARAWVVALIARYFDLGEVQL